MNIDLDAPLYGAGKTARAAGVEMHTLQDWLRREAIVMGAHDLDNTGSGNHRAFTARRVMQVSIAGALAGIGMDYRAACEAAREFTDCADGPTGYAGDSAGVPSPRNPGELFSTGTTWLTVDHAGSPRIVENRDLDREAAPIALALDPIVERVMAALAAS